MSVRDGIVAALRGELPERVPWTIYGNLLPRGQTERELRDRGLGLVAHAATCSVERPNVTLAERPAREGDKSIRIRTYQTPVGELTEKRETEPGYNSSWAFEHFVKGPRDYEVLEYIVRDARVTPDYANYERVAAEIAGDGIVNTSVPRMPFQRLWVEFAGLDRLLLDLHDYPELVEGVLRAMMEKDAELWEVVADSPSEFVWLPDNITARAISPRIFDRYFAPYYEAVCDVMHRHGKRVYCHMDGSLQPLSDRIARLPVDIVEAFTPTPTGDVSVAEARAAWKGKVLWLNFPSSVLIEEPEAVAAVTRDLLRQATPGDGFLMGVTENVPETTLRASLAAITGEMERSARCPLAG